MGEYEDYYDPYPWGYTTKWKAYSPYEILTKVYPVKMKLEVSKSMLTTTTTTTTTTQDPATPPKKTVKQVLAEAAREAADLIVKERLLDIVLKATPGLDPDAPPVPTSTTKSPKALEVENLIRSRGWAGRNDLRQDITALAELILGEPLDTEIKTISPKKFMLVIPLTNPNSHNYTIGNVCMLRHDGSQAAELCADHTLRNGVSLPTGELGNPTVFRFPSKHEAAEFVGKLLSKPENIQNLRDTLPDFKAYFS